MDCSTTINCCAPQNYEGLTDAMPTLRFRNTGKLIRASSYFICRLITQKWFVRQLTNTSSDRNLFSRLPSLRSLGLGRFISCSTSSLLFRMNSSTLMNSCHVDSYSLSDSVSSSLAASSALFNSPQM